MAPTDDAPLIGVNGLLVRRGDVPRLDLPLRYADSVMKAGGVPVAIAPAGGPADLARVLDRLDGLLLTGGDDFDTERLGRGPVHAAATPTPAEKQDFDFELVRLALERGLPVLGICYGMQLLAMSAGAELCQHLPDEYPDAGSHATGEPVSVRVEPGTKLARILGVEELEVVCRHHQALRDAGNGWVVSATSLEGWVEAVERPDHAFAVGVQWHPELSYEGSHNDRLFRGLVGAASFFAAGRSRVLT